MRHGKFLLGSSFKSSSLFSWIETLNCEMKREISSSNSRYLLESEKLFLVVISQHFALNFYKHFFLLLLYFYDSFEIFHSFAFAIHWKLWNEGAKGRVKEKSVKCEFIIRVLNLIYFDGSVLMAIFCRKKNILTMIIFVLWHTFYSSLSLSLCVNFF